MSEWPELGARIQQRIMTLLVGGGLLLVLVLGMAAILMLTR